jgi:ferredoxin
MPSEQDDQPPTAPEAAPPRREGPETESLVIRLGGRSHTVGYETGDTILGALRRAGLKPPFNCEAGNCGTCIARVDAGTATMRSNNVLEEDEVAEGWILTCQAVPTSREVVVDYDE